MELDPIFKKKFNIDSFDCKAVLTFTSPKNILNGKNSLFLTFYNNPEGRVSHKITFDTLCGDFLTEENYAQQIIKTLNDKIATIIAFYNITS